MSWILVEALAVVGNLAYTLLMMRERRIGWLFGIVASLLGVLLFMHQRVYAQVALNAFYVGMGVFGWWSWGQGGDGERSITRRRWPWHVLILFTAVVLSGLIGLGLAQLPEARYTGLDAASTALSLLATGMLARKILENWAYWIVADAAAIVLYMLLGLYGYAALYAVYVVISAMALRRWLREWRASRCPA